jgi:UDP-N-acetylglucosamine 1-carboxyvinyltransferase
MEQFIMKGGKPLCGEVVISGAKNAALGIIAGSLLTDDDIIIDNLPDVRDINVMLEALKEIGASVNRVNRHQVIVNAANVQSVSIDDEYIRKIRASYYFIGALLGKY